MAFNAGAMRIRADLQRRAVTQDSVGEQATTWTTVAVQVWIDAKALTGRELEAAQAVRAMDTHQIILRYLPGLTAKDRFIYTDPEGTIHTYALTDVTDFEMRHRYMECTAIEGLSLG